MSGLLSRVASALDMSRDARLKRARELGLNTPVYHGTRAEIEQFDASRSGLGTHVGTQEQANRRLNYLESQRQGGHASRNRYGEGDRVMPLLGRFDNSLDVRDVGRWDDSTAVAEGLRESGISIDEEWLVELEEIKRQFEGADDFVSSSENAEYMDFLRSQVQDAGYDSVRYANQVENLYGSRGGLRAEFKQEYDALGREYSDINNQISRRRPGLKENATEADIQEWIQLPDATPTAAEQRRLDKIAARREEIMRVGESSPYSYVALDDSQLRSINAAFDPARRGSSDILAGATGAAVIGGAATSNEAQAMPDREREILIKARARQRQAQTAQPGTRLPEPFARKGADVTREQAERWPQQLAETASAATEGIMWAPDVATQATIGGLRGVSELAQGNTLQDAVQAIRSAPSLTDAINMATGGRIGENFLPPGPERETYRGAGNLIPAAMGAATVTGRDIGRRIGDASAEFLGFGQQAPATIAGRALPGAPSMPKDVAAEVSPDMQRRMALQTQSGDAAAAGYRQGQTGGLMEIPPAVRDPVQKRAIAVGMDEGRVAQVSATDKVTRKRMRDMVTSVRKGLTNARYRDLNRPGDVIGTALENRLGVIRSANRSAGKAVDAAAEKLKTKTVDYSNAIDAFMSDLDGHGIDFDKKNGILDFSNSSIEGLGEAQAIIERMVKRLYDTATPPSAHDVHRAKRFIDNQVVYGKKQAGLSGEMVTILKRLRHNLDSALDQKFPEYDKANTAYRETIQVLDEIQNLAGGRIDLLDDNAERALGIMSRKVLSNYASGIPMLNTFSALDDVARRYGGPLKANVLGDNVVDLIGFESELRRLIPSVKPPNTFQGLIGTEVARAGVDAATGNVLGPIGRAAAKVMTPDEKKVVAARLKALENLLKD